MERLSERDLERQASRMHEMIRRLSVDAGLLVRRDGGAAYAAAHARCLECRDVGVCLHWLDGRMPGATPASFCPNVPLFRTCQAPPAHDYQI